MFKLEHGWGDITRGDNVLLVSNRGLDDGSVESIRDQANNKIVLRYRSVESVFVSDIEGDWLCELDALGELLCAIESSAGWRALAKAMRSVSRKWPTNRDLNTSVAQNIQSGSGNETRAAGTLLMCESLFDSQLALTASEHVEEP